MARSNAGPGLKRRSTTWLAEFKAGRETALYWVSLAVVFGVAATYQFKRFGPLAGPFSQSYLVRSLRLSGVSEAQALEAARGLVGGDAAASSAEALVGYQAATAHPVYPLLGAPLARLFGAWGLQAVTLFCAVVLAVVVARLLKDRYGFGLALGLMSLGLIGSGWLSTALTLGPDSMASLLAATSVAAVWWERTHPSLRLLALAAMSAFVACLTAPVILVVIGALLSCYTASALRWRNWRVVWRRGLVATVAGTVAAHLLQLILWQGSHLFNQQPSASGTPGGQLANVIPITSLTSVKRTGWQLLTQPGAGTVLAVIILVGLVFCWRSMEARLAAGAALGAQIYAVLTSQFAAGPWLLALVPALMLAAHLAGQLRAARRAPLAYWLVIGGSFAFQLVTTIWHSSLFVPDSRHYWAQALRFGGLPRDQIIEVLCGPLQPFGCLSAERLLDWDLVRPRFVYPALATPFVKLWGQIGLGVVSIGAAAAFCAVVGWYFARRFGRSIALVTMALGMASSSWFFFLVMMATESLSCLWSALMLVTAWQYARLPARRHLFWLAALVVLAAFTRQAVLVPAFAFGAALVGQWIVARRWRTSFTAPGLVVAGLGLVLQVLQIVLWPNVGQAGVAHGTDTDLGGWLRQFLATTWRVTSAEVGRIAAGDQALLALGLLTLVAAALRLRQIEAQLAIGGLAAGWLYLAVNASASTSLRYFEPALVFMLAAVAGWLRPVAWPDTALDQDERLLEHV